MTKVTRESKRGYSIRKYFGNIITILEVSYQDIMLQVRNDISDSARQGFIDENRCRFTVK